MAHRSTFLYVDVSGSTERYWREHRDQMLLWARAFPFKWMFHNDVLGWRSDFSDFGGTNGTALAAHIKTQAGSRKVVVVTDEPDLLKAQVTPLLPRGNIEFVTFESFFNLRPDGAHELANVMTELEEEFLRVMDKDDGRAIRNRRGVEMHVKLERVSDDLTRLREIDPHNPGLEAIRKRLHSLTERLLKEIFNLDMSKAKERKMTPASLPVDAGTGQASYSVETFSSTDVAVAKVRVGGAHGKVYEATAKRDPHDKPNAQVGVNLAVGRALRKAGNDLIRQANKVVAAGDKERRAGEAAKTQARSQQRKAEAKVRREKAAVERVKELEAEVARLQKAAARKPAVKATKAAKKR